MKFKKIDHGTGNDSFLTLKDGDKVKGVFRSDPHEFRQHFDKTTQTSSVCLESRQCPLCVQGHKSSYRFFTNFIIKGEDGAYIAKIFAGGSTVAQQLDALSQDCDLQTTIVTIRRSGSGLETTYSIGPIVGDNVLKNGALKAVQATKLLDLEPTQYTKKTEPEPKPAPKKGPHYDDDFSHGDNE